LKPLKYLTSEIKQKPLRKVRDLHISQKLARFMNIKRSEDKQ
jgi:hypothetical protein